MLASREINSVSHNVPSDPQSRDKSSRLHCLKEVALANPYLQYGHVRWQDGEHLLREEREVTESEDQMGFFQRLGPACGVSTASQRRMTPIPGSMNLNTAVSLSLPRASRYPPSLSFGVKISNVDVFSILQHCPLKGDVYFIDVKKSHTWTWRAGLGIAWRILSQKQWPDGNLACLS